MKVEWADDALKDLDRLHNYLLTFSEAIADEAILTILENGDELITHPELGRAYQNGLKYRELVIPFRRRGYILRYRIIPESIIILRIWHGLEDR